MKRALLVILDSVGIGHAPDAAAFGDEGADTVGHIREKIPGLAIPTLDRCGLAHAEALAAAEPLPDFHPSMAWGCLTELSSGKDTTTGHWELAGIPVAKPFATFPSFPDALVEELEKLAGVTFLGNYARSGTVILEELGEEHLRTGNPILYTSSDSVLQIAAHEDVISLDRLYEICESCRPVADRERIGRVIARPFTGEPGSFRRTPNRRDFSMEPPRTILDALVEHGVNTVGIGKISDIFAGKGIAESFPTKSNGEGMAKIEELWRGAPEQPTLFFANLVDFDMLYGHRRDVEGYASALEEFDRWLDGFLPLTGENRNSLFLISADHGNDPTWRGTDHTRERVPLLASGPFPNQCVGVRETFSDIAATIGHFFQLPAWHHGTPLF